MIVLAIYLSAKKIYRALYRMQVLSGATVADVGGPGRVGHFGLGASSRGKGLGLSSYRLIKWVPSASAIGTGTALPICVAKWAAEGP